MSTSGDENILYVWRSALPRPTDYWLKLEEKDIQVTNNCKIYIWLQMQHCSTGYILQVSVRKTNHLSTSVVLMLQVSGGGWQTRTVSDWTESYDINLSNIIVSSWEEIREITCTVTWPASFLIPQAPNLHDKMSNYVMNSALSDVIIVIGEKQLPAHKLMLCSWSDVFLKMLTSSMKESQENRIVIKDVELEIIEMVLRFMYTGDEKNFEEVDIALKVLAVAEKYEIDKLKEICEYKLYKKLTSANVLKVLDEADNHEASTLKFHCFRFIFKNKKDITETEPFHNLCLAKPELMYQLITSVFSQL